MSPPTRQRPHFAISIRQPWAALIVAGRKTIEVRSWSVDYRGPLFIHTGKKPAEEFIDRFPDIDTNFQGGLLGVADLADIQPFTQALWSRLRSEHLVPGPMPNKAFGWRFERPRKLLHPVPLSGQLGLFTVPDNVSALALTVDLQP